MSGPETTELEVVDAVLAGHAVPPEHADLAELTLLLRAERPEPAPSWATHLDRKVAAGFPGRSRRRLRISWPAFAPVAGLTATAGVIALLVITAPEGGDEAASGGAGSAMSTAQEDSARPASEGALAPQDRRGDPRSDARGRRQVEHSASLTLGARPGELDRMASDVGDVAADLGGFVASSRVTSSDGGRLELRVPSRRLDTAIQRLSELGSVRELSRESLDITSTVVSARDRLADARAERRSLLRQLEAAETVNETESLRERLRIVSRQIAAARARAQRAQNRARFANVAVTLVRDVDGTRDDDGGAWTPGDAFRDALRVLEVTAGVALIALAVLLPLGLAWLLAWLTRRGVTRRRRERALDMA